MYIFIQLISLLVICVPDSPDPFICNICNLRINSLVFGSLI